MKCLICFAENNHMWEGEPSIFCPLCSDIRTAADGTLTQVLPNLYLSDAIAAQTFDGEKICVHENADIVCGKYHMPIMLKSPPTKEDRFDAKASVHKLCDIAVVIDNLLRDGKRVLIHCQGGVERSPLTVAWYLSHYGHQPSITAAYLYLKQLRPVISDRTFWL